MCAILNGGEDTIVFGGVLWGLLLFCQEHVTDEQAHTMPFEGGLVGFCSHLGLNRVLFPLGALPPR